MSDRFTSAAAPTAMTICVGPEEDLDNLSHFGEDHHTRSRPGTVDI